MKRNQETKNDEGMIKKKIKTTHAVQIITTPQKKRSRGVEEVEDYYGGTSKRQRKNDQEDEEKIENKDEGDEDGGAESQVKEEQDDDLFPYPITTEKDKYYVPFRSNKLIYHRLFDYTRASYLMRREMPRMVC